MKDYKSKGRRYGSVTSRSNWVKRDSTSGRFVIGEASVGKIQTKVKVFAGPSVDGSSGKLIEVVSGNVVDKSPFSK
jgi:hypothetical protein